MWLSLQTNDSFAVELSTPHSHTATAILASMDGQLLQGGATSSAELCQTEFSGIPLEGCLPPTLTHRTVLLVEAEDL